MSSSVQKQIYLFTLRRDKCNKQEEQPFSL